MPKEKKTVFIRGKTEQLRGTCGGVNVVSPFKLRQNKTKKPSSPADSSNPRQPKEEGQSSLRSAEKPAGHSGFREQTAGMRAKRRKVTKTDLGLFL